MVPGEGLEPTHQRRTDLNRLRLPIPPTGHGTHPALPVGWSVPASRSLCRITARLSARPSLCDRVLQQGRARGWRFALYHPASPAKTALTPPLRGGGGRQMALRLPRLAPKNHSQGNPSVGRLRVILICVFPEAGGPKVRQFDDSGTRVEGLVPGIACGAVGQGIRHQMSR